MFVWRDCVESVILYMQGGGLENSNFAASFISNCLDIIIITIRRHTIVMRRVDTSNLIDVSMLVSVDVKCSKYAIAVSVSPTRDVGVPGTPPPRGYLPEVVPGSGDSLRIP